MATRAVGNKAFWKLEGVQSVELAARETITYTQGLAIKKVYVKAAVIVRDAVVRAAPYRPRTRTVALSRRKWPHTREVVVIGGARNPNYANVLVMIDIKKTPQAYWYEFGTVKQAPRPFFRPAIRAVRSQVKAILSAGIEEALTNPNNFSTSRRIV